MVDEEIVGLFLARREKAIDETQRKYGKYLTAVAYNILGNYEDSRESVNDTYLRAWNSIPPHTPKNLKTYLSKIIRRVCIDLFRRRGRLKRGAGNYEASLTELEECFYSTVSPEEEVEAGELGRALNEFLSSLEETNRNLFIMRYFYFDSLRDIAAFCNLSQEAVAGRLFRIRRDLRSYLIKEEFIYES